MSKIIIYDNKNILIANLNRTEKRKDEKFCKSYGFSEKSCKKVKVENGEYAAIFNEFKILRSSSLKKQLKKIEKIFKYHKEGGKNVKKSI